MKPFKYLILLRKTLYNKFVKKEVQRPLISQFNDPVEFMQEMIRYRKKSVKGFSVATFSKSLRRLSPSLISLILKRQRRINLDRVDEIAKLLDLSASEKFVFKNWVVKSLRLCLCPNSKEKMWALTS